FPRLVVRLSWFPVFLIFELFSYTRKHSTMSSMISRRTFLSAAGTAMLATAVARAEDYRPGRKKMAIVTTEWRYGSHAWHLRERFLVGYPVQGKWHQPPLEVVAAYVA